MTVSGREPKVFRNKLRIDMDEVAILDHGDEWQFGEQEFLAHIHYGIEFDFCNKNFFPVGKYIS